MQAPNPRRRARLGAATARASATLALLALLATAAAGRPGDPPAPTRGLDGAHRRAAPAPPSIVSAPRDPSPSRTARFELSGTGEGARLRCRLDRRAAVRCRSPVEYRGLADGPHRFRVRAVDRRRARSAPASHRWTIDTRRPPRPALTDRPDRLTHATTARLRFSDREAGLRFTCRLDALAAVPCTSPTQYDGLAQGEHRFSVIATDAAGNASAPAAHAWTVDSDAPAAPVVLEAPSDPTSATSARFAFRVDTGARLECALDDGAAGPCANPLELAGLAEGGHRLVTAAVDGADNVSEAATYAWSIDTTAPARPTITSHPDSLTPRTDAELRFEGERGTTLLCRLDGALTVPCTSPQTYAPLADGRHTFTVAARDDAGNRSAPAELTWTVDTTLYRSRVMATGGLLAYWRLGETQWAPAADETGAFPGAYTRGVTLGAPGALTGDGDPAAGFDGSYGEMFAPSGSAPGATVSGSATLEGWFDWRRGTAVMRDNTGPSRGWILAYETRSGQLAYRAGGAPFTTGLAVAALRDGWHHLVLTKSGGDVAFYVDGRPVHAGTGAGSDVSLAPWHVMGNGTNAEFAEGRADEVAVYGVALGPEAVLSHYQTGSGR